MSMTVRECGCSEMLDPVLEGWVLVDQCAAHAETSRAADYQVRRLLDHELDANVQDAAGGKRVKRIYPSDPTK